MLKLGVIFLCVGHIVTTDQSTSNSLQRSRRDLLDVFRRGQAQVWLDLVKRLALTMKSDIENKINVGNNSLKQSGLQLTEQVEALKANDRTTEADLNSLKIEVNQAEPKIASLTSEMQAAPNLTTRVANVTAEVRTVKAEIEHLRHNVPLHTHTVPRLDVNLAKIESLRGSLPSLIANAVAAEMLKFDVRPCEFRCGNLTCISTGQVCDRNYDCKAGSDERGCGICNAQQFRCPNGVCIAVSQQCDKINDCADGSDKRGCGVCSTDQFQCKNNNCVGINNVWNGNDDCGDGSDEGYRGPCNATQFTCRNNKCVLYGFKCHGWNTCGDGSNKFGCGNCNKDQFSCWDTGKCISPSSVCDGKNDCGQYGLDECGCGNCTYLQFRCKNNNCVNWLTVCDKENDCGDGSEELNCPS